TPAEVEDIERRQQALEVEAGIIEREEAIGIDVADRKGEVEAALAVAGADLAAARERWDAEKAMVEEILDLRARLRGAGAAVDETGSAGDMPPPEADPPEGAAEATGDAPAGDAAPPAASLSPEERTA